MILNFFLPLLGSFLRVSFLQIWFFPMIALAFICTVPKLIKYLFRRG